MDNNYNWVLDLDYISHYGVPHGHGPHGGSGRYPWGSGAKNGFRKITDAAVRLKKFFQKDRVKTTKNEDDELFGLMEKRSNGTLSEKESLHLTELMNKKYGLNNAQTAEEINKIHEKANADFRSRKMGEMFNKIQDEKTRADSDGESKTISEITRQETKQDGESKTISEMTRQETKQDREAARKAALDSGDRNEIAKYFNESSYVELQQALQKAELKDRLNESLAKAYKEAHPESQEKIPTAEEQRKEYVKQELWSGDLNRIMSVVNDKSINPDELRRAVDKANQVQTINRQLNPTVGDKVAKAFDTTINAYDKVAPLYNVVASINNQTNRNTKMPILPVKSNNNQQKQNNQQNQQQNQQKQNPQPQQTQQKQQQANNQTQSQPQQTQATQRQQQVKTIKNLLNIDTLKSPQSEKFYQDTIANIIDKPISSQSKTVEFTPKNNNGVNNPTDVKWLKMTIDPSVLNRKL